MTITWQKTAALLAGLLVYGQLAAHQNLADKFEKLADAVVVIHTTERAANPNQSSGLTSIAGLGSGVIIDKQGTILTAAHVVHNADSVEVELRNGDKHWARILSSEPATDLALLRIEEPPTKLVWVKLGDSDRTRIGDPVFIIGAPYGIGYSLSTGTISGRQKGGDDGSRFAIGEFFQTDAAINQGNSGGPMFNQRGEVIGIVSFILSQSGGFEGLGFAATSNLARERMLERPSLWTGVETIMLGGDIAKAFNVPQPFGMLVQRVARGSNSELLGLRGGEYQVTIAGQVFLIGGDVILNVMDVPVDGGRNYDAIREKLYGVQPGHKVTVTVLRGGELVELTLFVRAQPD